MGAKVVTITSGKGGVGKTTATANLGVALARMNKKVVVIDADIGLRNLDIVMGLENRIVYDLVDIVEGRCKVRQAMIKHKQFNDLYLIPAAQTRDKTAVITDQKQAGGSNFLDAPLSPQRNAGGAWWPPLVPFGIGTRGIDTAGGDHIDPDVLCRKLRGETSC